MDGSVLRALRLGFVAAAAVLAVTVSSFAGSGPDIAATGPAGPGSNVGSESKKPGNAKAHLVYLAGEMAVIGRKQKDALSMIQSARLLIQAGGLDTPRQHQAEGGEGPTTKAGRQADTPESLLAEARVFAQGNPQVLAIIDMVGSSAGTRSAVGGPKRTVEVVRALGRDRFRPISFYGNELAEVGLVGDGDSDLDLLVYDQSGNLICQSTDSDDTEYCAWYPRWTGPFTVVVRNYGRVANRYVMATN